MRFTPEDAAYLSHDALPRPLQGRAMSLEDLLKLAAAQPTVRLNLDMKETSGVREMAGLIRSSGMASRVLLTGVTRGAVSEVRDGADGLPYLLNAHPNLRQRLTASGAAALAREIKDCGALGLNVHHRLLTRRLARVLSAAGLSVSVWTVDGEREMRRMIRLPVHNITTRKVDRLLAMHEGRGP